MWARTFHVTIIYCRISDTIKDHTCIVSMISYCVCYFYSLIFAPNYQGHNLFVNLNSYAHFQLVCNATKSTTFFINFQQADCLITHHSSLINSIITLYQGIKYHSKLITNKKRKSAKVLPSHTILLFRSIYLSTHLTSQLTRE